MSELYSLTIKEASEKLAKGEITSVELTKSVLDRIEKVEPRVGAYISLCKEEALEAAKVSDERRKCGKTLGELDGIPVGVKDIILTKDIRTTAASKILEDFIPPYNATVYEKLEKAGCVLIGKTNLDEFAMGSSTENSALQHTENPRAFGHVPGGSSGGSAAAVAADECLFALGTDTGCSIRTPASFCGVTGLKVSYGLVSRYGVISYASSFDTIGPITKTVEDTAIVLKCIAGNDPKDSTTTKISNKDLPDYTKLLRTDLKGFKIGIPKEFFAEATNPEVAKIIKENSISILKKLGAEIIPVSLPMTKYAIATYYILVKSEASSNLARYDGIHYGKSPIKEGKAKSLLEIYESARSEGFGAEPKRSIMLGTYTLSAGYFDAYYKKAAKVRSLMKKEYEEIFKKVDLLIAPVSPFPAFKFGEKIDNPLEMYLADINAAPINIAGIPAISVPAGETSERLPVGLQIIGPMFGEDKILQAGYAFQSVTDHHKVKPNLD